MTSQLPNLTNDNPPLKGVTDEAVLGLPCCRLWDIVPQITNRILCLCCTKVQSPSWAWDEVEVLSPKPARKTHVHQDPCLNLFNTHLSFPKHSPYQELLLGSHSYQGGENFLLEERLLFPYPCPSCWKECCHSPWKQTAIKLKVHKKWKVKLLGMQWYLTFIVHFYLFVPPAWHITRMTRVKTVSWKKQGVASSNRQPEKIQSASCFQAWKVLLSYTSLDAGLCWGMCGCRALALSFEAGFRCKQC